MNKRLSRNLSLLLCFALLLQLMAGPIGSLIPAASAAETAATNQTTKLVKKVLYSEDFSAYTTAQALSGSAAVGGWTINGGNGLTASLTDGKLYFKNTSGIHLIRLDVPADTAKGIPASSEWQNYTLEADWTYENVSSNTMYYAGMAVNAIDKDNLQKAGLDDQNDDGATKYTINGRISGGWDKNNGGPAAQSGSLKFEMNRGDTFRYRIVLSGCNGETDSVLAFYAAKYDTNGKLGEWVEVATRANMPANLPAKGTIGVFTNNAVSGFVDNIEVYQWEEKTVETTTKTLYSEDFSSADALGVWTTSLTSGNSWEVKDGKLYIHEEKTGYDWYWLNLPANEEAGIPASSEWSDYTVEADMTYVSGADGDGQNNGTWLGLMLNSTNTDNFLKGSVTTKYGAWANGKDHGKWMLADKDQVIKDNPMENGLEFGDTFRLRVTSSGVRTTVSMAIYEDGTLGQWKELFSHDLTGEILQKGTIGFVGGNTAGEYIIDNILVTQEVPVSGGDEPEQPPVNPNLPQGAKLLYEEDFEGYEGTTTLGTTAIDGWYLDLSAGGASSANISGGQLNFANTDGDMGVLLLDLPADVENNIPASREWKNYTVEVDWDYTGAHKYYAGFVYNGQNINSLQKAGLDLANGNGNTKYTVNGRSTEVKDYWVNNLQKGDGVLNQTETDKVDLHAVTKWRYKIETSGNNGTDEATTTFSVAPIVDGVRGDWVEIVTVENIYPATWKGTIGIFGRNNVACSVDNIIVYTTEEQTPVVPPQPSTDPSEDPTDPPEPPAPPKDPFEFEGEPETLFKEDFSKYADTSVELENGMNYKYDWYKRSGNDFKVELKDGAMYVTSNAATNYGFVYLNGGYTWGNYVYEADISYLSGSGTGNAATWGGLVFNVKDNGDGTFGYFKGSLNDTKSVFLNGDRNFGTGGWDFDTDKVNKDLGKDSGITLGDTYRLRVTTVDNHAKLEMAKYDAQGNLGAWTEYYRIDNIPSDMRTGTIGFMTGRGTSQFKVDNIHVYEYDKVVYNETFDYANATITAANAAAHGLDITGMVSSTARIQDGKLYMKDGGSGYDFLHFLVGKDWTNYTLELDLSHTNEKGWTGVLYRATLGKDTYQKAGLTVDNEAGNNKGLMTTNSRLGGNWYNLQTYPNPETNYSNRNQNTNVKVNDVLRFKIIVEEDRAEFWTAEYTDYAKGTLGEWTLWNTIEGEQRFAPEHLKGTIGLMNDGNGSGVEFWVDNIQVSHGSDRKAEAPKPANVADIYLPDTGITNAPVAVQKITTALPDTSKSLPAIALMEIDKDLNIVGTGKTVADFYAEYRYSVIGGWIIDTEEETDALIQFIKDNDILDVYIIGAESEITYSEYKVGSGVYTGTSDTVQLVKKVFDAVPTIRGGLMLPGSTLTSDLNGDGKADYADLAVICNMVTNDTGITQLIFDSTVSVDAMTYFNNHATGAWSFAKDAAEVYSGVATGAHAIVAEVPATIYDVYESIDTVTLSGRPVPITHRGSHMNYGRETEVVTREDGSTFTFYGETENSVEAMLASWNYFGIIGSEIDLCTTAVCSGDDATCSHTIIEGADACDHVNCALCQTNIILEHDKNLPNTTNFNAMKSQYPNIFNRGVAPQSYTLFELKMLTLTGKGNNQPSGTKKLATFEEVLAATEDLAGGNYVYYCHINHSATVDYFNKVLAEHPEYIDNCVIFEEPGEILQTKGYNIKYLTAPVAMTFATDGHTQAGIMQAGITELEALERVIKLFNPNMGSSLIYQYYDFTDGDDSFYYQIGARGVISYHSITTNANVNKYHITEAGSEGCLIEQPKLVDDWFYFINAPKTMTLAAGADVLDLSHDVRTIVGDRHEADNLSAVTCGFTQISGPELILDSTLGGYTAAAAGEAKIVFYYDGTAEGASYRIYSEPVTVTITADPVSVTLDVEEAELEVAETLTLKATVSPAGVENKIVTWTSSDDSIAKVAADGTVTAIAKGTATITATTVNGLTAECVITVTGVSDEAAAVIEAIDEIGTVSLDSGDALAQLREAYEALTPIQKAQVGNYAELLAAEKAYIQFLKDAQGDTSVLTELQKQVNEAKEKAETAAAEAKTAEDAAKAAEDAKVAAEAAAAEALANETLSAQEKAAAVAAAEQAKQDAEAAAEAAEAAAKAQQDAEAALTAAEETLKQAVAEAEEAIKEAEKAEAAAALAEAKYEAVQELLDERELLEVQAVSAAQAKALREATNAAQAAIDAAETPEAVAAALEAGLAALEKAMEAKGESKFEDVKEGTYYYEAVEFMSSMGYMKGVSDTIFDVNGQITRGQLVTMLYRIEGSPSVAGLENPFTDLAEGAYYVDAVIWAASEGVVKGISETEFAPNQTLTREQFATMLYRWSKEEAPKDALKGFEDAGSVSNFAVEGMNWAVANGLINGVDDVTLAPQETATRAQAATILARYLA